MESGGDASPSGTDARSHSRGQVRERATCISAHSHEATIPREERVHVKTVRSIEARWVSVSVQRRGV